jgi:hypothetical protein
MRSTGKASDSAGAKTTAVATTAVTAGTTSLIVISALRPRAITFFIGFS